MIFFLLCSFRHYQSDVRLSGMIVIVFKSFCRSYLWENFQGRLCECKRKMSAVYCLQKLSSIHPLILCIHISFISDWIIDK